MNTTGRLFILLLALGACAPHAVAQTRANFASPPGEVAAAQISGSPYGLERTANEFGVWGGGSWESPSVIGKTEQARLAILGLRYARILARGENVALKYTLDAVPVALLSYPTEFFERRQITAAGLSPVGFQVNFRRREKVQPFAQGSGGFLYFGERVPDERGKQFNFTADFGGGVQVKTGARRAWTLGYRYQHVSNGYRGQVNPGFDANLFYIGYSIFR